MASLTPRTPSRLAPALALFTVVSPASPPRLRHAATVPGPDGEATWFSPFTVGNTSPTVDSTHGLSEEEAITFARDYTIKDPMYDLAHVSLTQARSPGQPSHPAATPAKTPANQLAGPISQSHSNAQIPSSESEVEDHEVRASKKQKTTRGVAKATKIVAQPWARREASDAATPSEVTAALSEAGPLMPRTLRSTRILADLSKKKVKKPTPIPSVAPLPAPVRHEPRLAKRTTNAATRIDPTGGYKGILSAISARAPRQAPRQSTRRPVPTRPSTSVTKKPPLPKEDPLPRRSIRAARVVRDEAGQSEVRRNSAVGPAKAQKSTKKAPTKRNAKGVQTRTANGAKAKSALVVTAAHPPLVDNLGLNAGGTSSGEEEFD